jgi:hypothetical protein
MERLPITTVSVALVLAGDLERDCVWLGRVIEAFVDFGQLAILTVAPVDITNCAL